MLTRLLLTAGIVALFFAHLAPALGQVKLRPLWGEDRKVVVKKGDTLYRIARRHDVSMSDVVRANGLSAKRPKPGQMLIIPLRRILPHAVRDGIVLNLPERRIYLFRGGQVVQTHAVAVGKPDWPTSRGTFRVTSRMKNPTWYPPRSMVKREGHKEDPVPPGPENPLGDRWIGWSDPGTGFHSTTSPRSIGGVVSHGCVRLYPERAQQLFDSVKIGMPIYSVYETVLLAQEGGSFYLSVWPDIYGRGGSSLDDIQKLLREAELLGGVDPDGLKRLVRRAPGLPHRIVGSEFTVEVNGTPVAVPVDPTLIGGRWVVAARQTVEALGGTLANQPDGSVQITAGTRTLVVTPDSPEAQLDGAAVDLPVTPSVVADTLLVPLRTLLDLFGAELRAEETTLRVSTVPREPEPPERSAQWRPQPR